MLARLYFNIVSIMILFYVVHTLKIIENPEVNLILIYIFGILIFYY